MKCIIWWSSKEVPNRSEHTCRIFPDASLQLTAAMKYWLSFEKPLNSTSTVSRKMANQSHRRPRSAKSSKSKPPKLPSFTLADLQKVIRQAKPKPYSWGKPKGEEVW